MNQLLHHFRKDLRHTRGMMLTTLLIAAGVLWFPSVPLDDRVNQIGWLAIPRYGSWLLLFLTVARLVLFDAPIREEGFLRTRPVSTSTVIQAKCLIAWTLIIPIAMIECVMLLMLDLKPGVIDLLLIYGENFLILSAIATVGMALAIREESFGKWLASALLWGGGLLVVGFTLLWFQKFQQRSEKEAFSYALKYLDSSRLIMSQLVVLTGASIGIIYFIRSRNHQTMTKVLGITVVCAATTWFFWPLNFVNAFVPERRTAPKSDWPDQASLKYTIIEQEIGDDNMSSLTFSDAGWNDLRYRSIRGMYSMNGLPDGWLCGHNGYESEVKLNSGKLLPSQQHAWAPINMEWILPELGIDNGFPKIKPRLFNIDYAEFNLADAVGAMEGATVKGLLHISLKRAVLLARIPFKTGGTTHAANRRFDITTIERSEDRIDFRILAQTSLVELRGGWQKIWTDRVEYIVINAARGEFLEQQSGGQSNPKLAHYALQAEESSCGIYPRFEQKPIPPDWLDDAELLIVGEEYGGTFSESFKFPNITLSQGQ